MLVLADNRGDSTLAWAGSDPGTAPATNYGLALMGVGRMFILAYPIWELLNASLRV